jgi:hypothetical protein
MSFIFQIEHYPLEVRLADARRHIEFQDREYRRTGSRYRLPQVRLAEAFIASHQKLAPGRSRSPDRRPRRRLQSPAISREHRQPDARRRLFRTWPDHSDRKGKDQTTDHRQPPLAAPSASCITLQTRGARDSLILSAPVPRTLTTDTPFNLGDDPARLRPASGLIGEICIGTPHFVRRPPNRARQKVAPLRRVLTKCKD